MGSFQIFGLQFLVSFVVYALIARWYLVQRLAALPLRDALQPLLLLHSLRTLGMTLLVPAVVSSEVPRQFAVQLAYGDLLAAGLALLSLAALRARAGFAIALVWIFNIEGFLDLLNAFYLGVRHDVTRYQLGAAWYTPTYVVPALLVTHLMIFSMLVKRKR